MFKHKVKVLDRDSKNCIIKISNNFFDRINKSYNIGYNEDETNDDSVVYYENEKGFGIYSSKGIDTKSIISSIKKLQNEG